MKTVLTLFVVTGFLYSGVYSATTTSCHDNWVAYKGSCYFFAFDQTLSFTEAEHYCMQRGGYLVEIHDVHEENFLLNFVRHLKPNDWWIGLSDQDIEGEFQWVHSMATPGYTRWDNGQPDTHNGVNEDCVALLEGFRFTWHDIPCDDHNNFVCEMIDDMDLGIIG